MNFKRALIPIYIFLFSTMVLADAPKTQSLSIDYFIKEADLKSAKVSPDGHYLAQLWNKESTRIVLVKDLLADNQPVIGKISDGITPAFDISWSNNQRLLISILVPYDVELATKKSKEKDFDIKNYLEFTRVVSTDVKLENGVVLLNDQKRVFRTKQLSNVKLISKDPNHVLITAWTDTWPNIFKVDTLTGTSQFVTHGTPFTFGFLCDDYGAPLYRIDFMPIAKKLIIFKFLDKDSWEEVASIDISTFNDEAKWDERELVAIEEKDLIYRKRNETTGFNELLRYKSEEKKTETFVSLPNEDVLAPITDLGSQKIIGYSVDGDHIRNRYFDEKRQARYDSLLEKLADYNFSITSKTDDKKTAVVEVWGADNPSGFYFYNYDSKQLNLINYGRLDLNPSVLGRSAIANFMSRDNTKIHSYILFPPNYIPEKKYPLVVLPHGGPTWRDTATYDNFAQFLATRGYLVIKPNFRGSTGYGLAFEQAGYKQWGQLMQDDVDDAAKFMIRKGYADPSKICIAGISYGGYSALMGTIRNPDFYKCAVSINGVTHLRKMIATDKKQTGDAARFEKYWLQRVGDPTKDEAMLNLNSPALQTHQIKVPVLVIASKQDTIVTYDQATLFVDAMNKNKKAVKLITLEKSWHNPFANDKDAKTTYEAIETFLSAQLDGTIELDH